MERYGRGRQCHLEVAIDGQMRHRFFDEWSGYDLRFFTPRLLHNPRQFFENLSNWCEQFAEALHASRMEPAQAREMLHGAVPPVLEGMLAMHDIAHPVHGRGRDHRQMFIDEYDFGEPLTIDTLRRCVDQMRPYMIAPEFTPAAIAKSKATLREQLTPAQRGDFDTTESFDVVVKGRGSFIVNNNRSFSVTERATNQQYCLTTPEAPIYDQMLAIKLLLESDPKTFFRTANKGLNIAQSAEPQQLPGEQILPGPRNRNPFSIMNNRHNWL